MHQPIEDLRGHMRANGVDATLVFTNDPHSSEYVGDHFKTRQYLSGFTGSAGTLVVFMDTAALFTDSRYFLQAEQELSGSGIQLMRVGEEGVPALEDYLSGRLTAGGAVSVDGWTLTASDFISVEEKLKEKNCRLLHTLDLAGEVFKNRPPLEKAPLFFLDECYAGESAQSKLARLRQEMERFRCSHHLITTLDDIAWLFNFRGGDVAYSPVALCYALIERERAFLYIDLDKLNEEMRQVFTALHVEVLPYEEIGLAFQHLQGGDCVLLSSLRVNYSLYADVKSRARIVDAPNPTGLMKSVKNKTEQENFKKAHLKDGAAVLRLIRWLKNSAVSELATEMDAAEKIHSLRMAQDGYLGESFAPITGYGPHGAIVHYQADETSNTLLKAEGFLLADTGGHYYEGTTDVTRTVAMGSLTQEMKRHFTLVLKGMLALMRAQFPVKTYGYQLDAIARLPLWSEGLQYGHGTGHGVGYLLFVHEPPASIRPRSEKNTEPLRAGMVVSDEPGYYLAGQYGIRIENLLLVTEKTKDGQFLGFEPLTLAPIDLDAVDPSLLTEEERRELNAYHAQVYAALSPYLDEGERAFLARETREI